MQLSTSLRAKWPPWKFNSGIDDMLATAAMHPAIVRALAAFPQDWADRANDALHTLLKERMAADGAQAWEGSRLTGDGFPVECAFANADQRLRYTAEPGPRLMEPRQRLACAIRLLNELGSPIPADTVDLFGRLQRRDPLQYGAWIGGRHGWDGDEFKIYVEAPGGCKSAALLREIGSFFPAPRLANRTATLRMIAFAPAARRYEVYQRVKGLAPEDLPRVLAPCGLEGRAGEVLSCLADAYGYAIDETLPGNVVGISYALASASSPDVTTLFFPARMVWGSDRRIRQRYVALARGSDGEINRYQEVTAPLAERETAKTMHGMLGFGIAADRPMVISIGVRP